MRIAVVTGASSGMGREFVKRLNAQQHFDQIWVIARRLDRLEEIKAELGDHIRPISLDLQNEAGWNEYRRLLEEENPDVAVLVNASGYGKFAAFVDIPLDEQLGMIDLNAKSLTAMTYITLPYMKRGAQIYQIDSLSSFQPVPYIGVYGATKAYVLSFTRAVNAEIKKSGIKMMAVCPGWVKTEFFDHAMQTNSGEVQYFNRLYEAKDVVATGLHDLYKTRKDYSVHGLPIKFQVLLVKVMPHWFVMNVWLNQQKKPKNNKNLTK